LSGVYSEVDVACTWRSGVGP